MTDVAAIALVAMVIGGFLMRLEGEHWMEFRSPPGDSPANLGRSCWGTVWRGIIMLAVLAALYAVVIANTTTP